MKLGLGARPRISEMARAVGLPTTYEYIYHLASNFVHFNPNALLRMGWSKESKEHNFSFSIENMSGYYDGVCKFYGGILFVGFATFISRVPDLRLDLSKELAQIEQAIAYVERWPEIITFEEMNIEVPQRPPFFLERAMRELMRLAGDIRYGEILAEVKSVQPVRSSRKRSNSTKPSGAISTR